MAGIFTERIWQPCICQPNKLKQEIKKKLGEPNKKTGPWPTQAPPLESPLIVPGYVTSRICYILPSRQMFLKYVIFSLLTKCLRGPDVAHGP